MSDTGSALAADAGVEHLAAGDWSVLAPGVVHEIRAGAHGARFVAGAGPAPVARRG
jgi:quercetin dioxygenase-like cupin family protein